MDEGLLEDLWDTHCHFHLLDARDVLLNRLQSIGMGVLAMSVTPDEYREIVELYKEWPLIEPCLGLYPPLLNKGYIQKFFTYLPTARFIGEVGLDYSQADENEKRTQRHFFHKLIIESAQIGNKVISVHSRGASRDIVDIIGRNFPGTIILHWFSGAPEIARRAAETVYFSLNTVMIRSKRSKSLIKTLNPERLLLESDAPSVQYNNAPATPLDGLAVIEYLAQIWKEKPAVVAALLRKNTRRALKATAS